MGVIELYFESDNVLFAMWLLAVNDPEKRRSWRTVPGMLMKIINQVK